MPECRHCDEPATLVMNFENGDRVPVCARHEVYEADTRKKAGAPFKYSREPLSTKTAAPINAEDWWPSHTELYHVTDGWTWENKIRQEGLRPQGEHGETSGLGLNGWAEEPKMRSRQGHVYLTLDFDTAVDWAKQDPDLVILEVDPHKLDPQLIDSDEDAFLGGNPITPEGVPDPRGWVLNGDDRSWGDWADAHSEQVDSPIVVPQAMQGSRSIAYRGTIPPSAIRLVPAEEMTGAGLYQASVPQVTTIKRSEFHFGAGPDIEAWFETARQHGKPAVFQLIKPVSLEVRGGKIPIPGAEPIGESQDGLPIYRTLDLGWHPELQQRVNADHGPNGAPEQRDQYADLQPGRRGTVTDIEPMLKMVHVQIPLNDVGRLHPHQATGWLSFGDIAPLTAAGDPFVKQQR